MRAPDGNRRDRAMASALLERLADDHEADRDRIVRRLGFDPLTDTAPTDTARLGLAVADTRVARIDARATEAVDRPGWQEAGSRRVGSRRARRAKPRFGRTPGRRGHFAAALPIGVAAATVTTMAAVSVVVATSMSYHDVGTLQPRSAVSGSSAATALPATNGPLAPSASTTPDPTGTPTAGFTAAGAPGSPAALSPDPAAIPPDAVVALAPGVATGAGTPVVPTAPSAPAGGPATAAAGEPAAAAAGEPAATSGSDTAAASVRPVASGTAVTLGSGADWAAVVRRDGTVVFPEHPVIGALGVRWSGAQPGEAAPYSVSWSGGAPEQDHSDAATWLAIGRGGSATITVPALPHAATLTLYLGSQTADLAVSGAAQGSWAHSGADLAAVVVTVELPTSGAPAAVTVAPAAAQAEGVIGLAAASLS